MSDFRAWFSCINGCPGKHPLNKIIYKCPQCNDLLEVTHDMDALAQKSGEQWQQLFDERMHRTVWPYGSSVWGKKELVCPHIEDKNVVSTFEGGSNLYWAERYGKLVGCHDLWIKQCGNSHTGSFKDLGMTVLVSMVSQMRAEGIDIPAVACASTGDTSAALAAYCAHAGLRAIVFLPRNKVTTAQLIQPIANNAITLSIDTDFDGCMKLVEDVCVRNNIYLANSMNSLRIEGQKTVAIEICEQFNWKVPDVIIIPGGNLGNLSALGKGLSEMLALGIIDKKPRLVCAQTAQANPLYNSYINNYADLAPIVAGATQASAIQIGNPVSFKKAVKVLKDYSGIVEQATEAELADESALADKTGLYCCPHTGVALAVFRKLLARGDIDKSERVVIISTAHGLKFTEFKINYHEQQTKLFTPKHPNPPVLVDNDYDKVRDAIFSNLDNFKTA